MNSSLTFHKYRLDEGVYILSDINNRFESAYINVREKEKRVYSDQELSLLPIASDSNPHKKEWELRAKSYRRIKEYLRQKKGNIKILDLGCGNGWFCAQLSKSFNYDYYCIDVNLIELKQARGVFNSDKLNFIYADLFTAELPVSFFDIIFVNAAVQYFPDLKKLLSKLVSMINRNGEIHFIDSPFYKQNEVDNARKRTEKYYQTIGFPEMSENYFHHAWDELSDFKFNILYNPVTVISKFKQLIFMNDSPFPWIKIIR
ncbi:MAG TPA: methyltransferase domain-containing protein [Ignavibacteriaceae bacterium]